MQTNLHFGELAVHARPLRQREDGCRSVDLFPRRRCHEHGFVDNAESLTLGNDDKHPVEVPDRRLLTGGDSLHKDSRDGECDEPLGGKWHVQGEGRQIVTRLGELAQEGHDRQAPLAQEALALHGIGNSGEVPRSVDVLVQLVFVSVSVRPVGCRHRHGGLLVIGHAKLLTAFAVVDAKVLLQELPDEVADLVVDNHFWDGIRQVHRFCVARRRFVVVFKCYDFRQLLAILNRSNTGFSLKIRWKSLFSYQELQRWELLLDDSAFVGEN